MTRKDYDEAGCAGGCRDTIGGASLLVVLIAVVLVRVVRKVRTRS